MSIRVGGLWEAMLLLFIYCRTIIAAIFRIEFSDWITLCVPVYCGWMHEDGICWKEGHVRIDTWCVCMYVMCVLACGVNVLLPCIEMWCVAFAGLQDFEMRKGMWGCGCVEDLGEGSLCTVLYGMGDIECTWPHPFYFILFYFIKSTLLWCTCLYEKIVYFTRISVWSHARFHNYNSTRII